jgi:hypothetical protein
MLAAGLIGTFDLESTVTILQQRSQDFYRGPDGTRLWRYIGCQVAQWNRWGNHRRPRAEELGKRWRFFPTYAEV